MATIIGSEYDHIDYTTGNITTRHPLKDAISREMAEDLVAVQDATPSGEYNKIWIKETPENETEVPTYDEFQDLSDDVAELKNVFDDLVDIEYSPNLWNPDAVTDGIYISPTTGESASGDYITTDYIPVEAGEKYYGTWQNGSIVTNRGDMVLNYITCYDSSKTVIGSAGMTSATNPITIPEGVSFIRISNSNNSYYRAKMFAKSETAPDYQPYGILSKELNPDYLPIDETLTTEGMVADAKATGDRINEVEAQIEEFVPINGIEQVTPQNLQIVDAVISPNLIDDSKVTDGTCVDERGQSATGDYATTDFIPVTAGDEYYFTWKNGTYGNRGDGNIRWLSCYDENKTVDPSKGSSSSITTFPITIPEGISYVRLCYSNNAYYKDKQFEKGDAPTEYHPYGLISAVIKEEYIPDDILGAVTASANAVRFDESQSLDTTQKAQARTNIGAADASDVSTLVSDISAMNTATSADAGKALKAKTITGGKVTEWEFGEAAIIDNTLTQPGEAADAKATGDAISAEESARTAADGQLQTALNGKQDTLTFDNSPISGSNNPVKSGGIQTAIATEQSRAAAAEALKVNKPTTSPNGTSGQLLRTNGDGTTTWVDVGLPTDAQTADAVSDWLDAHPSATTTVIDGSLTEAKFSSALKLSAIKDYVTPEMFGNITGDASQAIADCVAYAIQYDKVIVFDKDMSFTQPIELSDYYIQLYSFGTLTYTGAGFAIKCQRSYQNLFIYRLNAPNGGGIQIDTTYYNVSYVNVEMLFARCLKQCYYCVTTGNHYVVYCKAKGNLWQTCPDDWEEDPWEYETVRIEAYGNDINDYVGEMFFDDMKLYGKNGFYIHSEASGSVRINRVSIEAIKETGIIVDNTRSIYIIDCRYAELQSHANVVSLIGKCGLKFTGVYPLYINKIDMTELNVAQSYAIVFDLPIFSSTGVTISEGLHLRSGKKILIAPKLTVESVSSAEYSSTGIINSGFVYNFRCTANQDTKIILNEYYDSAAYPYIIVQVPGNKQYEVVDSDDTTIATINPKNGTITGYGEYMIFLDARHFVIKKA